MYPQTLNIKAFLRERTLRPYKRVLREILSLGANVLLVMTALVGAWIMLVAQG